MTTELNGRVRAIGLFVGDQIEQLLLGAIELRGQEHQRERAQAMALLARDAAERVIQETVALLNSVVHADIAAFIRMMDDTRQAQQQLQGAVTALAEQNLQTAAAQRELATLMREVVAGLRADHHESTAT